MKEPDTLVFTGPKGARLRRNNFGKLVGWSKAVAAVGAPGSHFVQVQGSAARHLVIGVAARPTTDEERLGLAARPCRRTIGGMEARVLYFDGCPCWRTAIDRLGHALMLIGEDEVLVRLVEVQSGADAAASGFTGSPTILIDGDDLFPGPFHGPAAGAGGLACRLYPTSTGLAGAPTVDDLVLALRERNRS